MSVKPTRQRARIVRYESLDRIPIKPLNRDLIGMSDEEAERLALMAQGSMAEAGH